MELTTFSSPVFTIAPPTPVPVWALLELPFNKVTLFKVREPPTITNNLADLSPSIIPFEIDTDLLILIPSTKEISSSPVAFHLTVAPFKSITTGVSVS